MEIEFIEEKENKVFNRKEIKFYVDYEGEATPNLVLPYRLEANFRVNIANGNVSIEFAATPEQVFPSSVLLNGIGIVPSSREVRKRAASVYIQRLAILLAAIAFRSSSKILHVWVAATLDTANRHQCYLSVDFDRWRFNQIDVELRTSFSCSVRKSTRSVRETSSDRAPRL